jgi:HlyD family secretion protein
MWQVPISGTVVARDEILIYPQVSGFTIDALNVDIGDYVAQGDVLAELNKSTLRAQLAQAEAELARATASVSQAQSQINAAQATLTQAQSVLTRAQSLRTSGSGTQADLDQAITSHQTAAANLASANDGLTVAQAQQQQAIAQLDIAQLNLDHATLLAPADGLISARNGRLGAIASSAGDPIFRLIASGTVEVEAEVVETAMSGLAGGNEVLLNVAGIGPRPGKVRLISPIVDPLTRLGMVRITTEENAALRTGLFASGWIIVEKRDSIVVPATAVITDATGSYVLRVVDGIVQRRPVTVGMIWQDHR